MHPCGGQVSQDPFVIVSGLSDERKGANVKGIESLAT